jgi:hypothetical protein
MMDTVPTTPIATILTGALLGLTWAAARADDVGDVLGSGSIPQGLDGITFPAALVALAWALRGWTPTITIKHVHEVDPHTRKSVERTARIAAGHTITDHGDEG